MMDKKTLSAIYMNQHESVFKCPVCGAEMTVVALKSIVCTNHHSFDIAKQGYVNLTTRPQATKYDKQLFESRKQIADCGFFKPLSEKIAGLIIKETNRDDRSIKIIDTGCGEGSQIASIKNILKSQLEQNIVGVGVDLAKEGIIVAAKSYTELIWCVADLANCPYKDDSFDVILNILSPSNYTEFKRLLTEDGVVIKVVPRENYLKELRDYFFDETEKKTYSNQDIVDRFHDHFDSMNSEKLTYTVDLEPSLLASLIRMTPLSWYACEEKIQAFLQNDVTEITVDLNILIGRKRK